MLRMADRGREDSEAFDFATATTVDAAIPPSVPAVVPGRYGDHRAINWPSIAAVVMLHAVLLGAILQARQSYVRHKEAAMVVVNLTPPPPPPAQEAPPPPPAQPEIVAPPPIVQTPVSPRPHVATTPDPVPVAAPKAVTVALPAPAPVFSAPPGTMQAGDLSAQMLSGKPPRYPLESRRKKEVGTVTLLVMLGTDGRVSGVSVSKSSGFVRLDDAALDAVRGWRWAPQMRDGRPVLVRGFVDLTFAARG